jgi:hypothetical protein
VASIVLVSEDEEPQGAPPRPLKARVAKLGHAMGFMSFMGFFLQLEDLKNKALARQ